MRGRRIQPELCSGRASFAFALQTGLFANFTASFAPTHSEDMFKVKFLFHRRFMGRIKKSDYFFVILSE
jgi:hypothetical protein